LLVQDGKSIAEEDQTDQTELLYRKPRQAAGGRRPADRCR
jgi:hypothetical protein